MCGNYSREEIIQGRKLYEEIQYIFFFADNFSDWFEPGTQLAKKQNGSTGGVQNRRASRRKNLHQKLVISQMNTKRAAKLG